MGCYEEAAPSASVSVARATEIARWRSADPLTRGPYPDGKNNGSNGNLSPWRDSQAFTKKARIANVKRVAARRAKGKT